MAARLLKVLAAQYRALVSEPLPYLLPVLDEELPTVWWFFISGLPAPYEGGEYIFKLTAPEEFPHKPPSLEFLTPNGVFETGGPVCISVGEFHAEDKPGPEGSYGWRPSLGMGGFAREVLNGLICLDKDDVGIRIGVVSDEEKAALAARSREFNYAHYPGLMSLFNR